MLWDPGAVKKDGDEDEPDKVPVTPILVPMQNIPTVTDKSVPVLVPDVQELKDQFQQQQNMLTQIKETLKQNESQLSSKGKQVEVYANKLSQIRARSKNTQGKKSTSLTNPSSPKTITKKPSRENLNKEDNKLMEDKTTDNISKIERKGKVSELKKCLEENKIKFEQRTGKEQSENKKIESLVEQLKTQLEERDKTIQDLQKNIEQSTPKAPLSLPKKSKLKSDKESVASQTTQTNRIQPSEDSIEIIALQNRIYELEASVLDLQENLKEKESVIEARTQAVTLLSQDLSLKGKNTLESLEETRQEMRTMQNNFIVMEDQLKKDLIDRDNKLAILEEKCAKLESTNFELSLKNAEQQEKLVNLQSKYVESEKERNSLKELGVQGQTNDKLDELTKKINALTKELDDRNKSMIKMKIEHKNKIKGLNKTLETLKGASDDKTEILRLNNLLADFENVKIGLENRVAELEDEKGNLLLSVLDVDDFKVSEKKLKDQINELETVIQKQNEDIVLHLKTISDLENEKSDLIQSNKDKSILVENLQSKIIKMESEAKQDMADTGNSKLMELSRKIENMEAEYTRKIEDLKAEHCKEIEMLEAYYNSKVESVDRRELEEYRISTEINNIHVEEQIELLVREKQQLLEKLKSLSGVSSTDSLTFEKMEHSDLKDDKETTQQLGEMDLNQEEKDNKFSHLERIVNDQQILISDLQKTVHEEQQKTSNYQQKIKELEGTIKQLEGINITLKQQVEMAETSEPGKNQKSNLNAKNRIKKIEAELSQAKKVIEEQKEKLQELNLKLEEKEELIKKYTEKIELFEKDDWDRQNHWKNVEDDIDNVQELQKKCLSLENSLLELNEDCERLRKENIEVVHLLSEEKVKRRKLLEQLQSESESDKAEKRINHLQEILKTLEEKVEKLEQAHSSTEVSKENMEEDLQSKLEWANIVLTGKETEIFRLQNLLEDSNKTIEILQGDLTDSKSKLAEKEIILNQLNEQLKAKEAQLEEISNNFDKLQQCVDVANQKTATNESQLQELLATVKQMEGDVFRKESELQEIKGILAEKNLDMTNLRNRLEEVNSDLTYSYQEHLENMGKCLRDKESDYDALLAEKNDLMEINKRHVAEKEDIYNQKMEINNEIERLRNVLLEKEKAIADLTEKLNTVEQSTTEAKSQNIEEMKIKMKKLAANLKKRAQNEADLTKQLKQMEEVLSEKDKILEKLNQDVVDVTEKWTVEKSEKEQIRNDLSQVLLGKVALEDEKAVLKEKIQNLETQIEAFKSSNDGQIQKLETEIHRLNETTAKLQMIEKEDKGKIAHLESKASELLGLYEQSKGNLQDIEEERKTKETILQKLAEVTGKYEEIKFKHDQLILEKSDLENKLEDQFKFSSDKSILEAKIQENMAVIENLESELKKTQDQMKIVQEKYCHSEERRSSLENKNEEMCKKIMEDSETLVTIDDLSTRVEELLKSEKHLQNSVKNLNTSNVELKQMLEDIQSEKYNLETELKASADKIADLSAEIKHLKDAETEKSGTIKELMKELEKLKAEKKQISSEYEKLNKDYEQFENDYKESLENSQNIEKSLKRKIEELFSENSILQEKLNSSEEKSQLKSEEEEKKPKKRKSVTFRTDETEYIKELKAQLHKYDANLKAANEELEKVKAELLREKLRKEVENVVLEAAEKVESLKSTPEKEISSFEFPKPTVEPEIIKSKYKSAEKPPEERKFDASVFFGSENEVSFFDKTKTEEQTPETDSLMWDDGWGTDGQLEEEYLSSRDASSKVKGDSNRVQELEVEMKKLEADNEKLKKDLQESTVKYAKVVKKLKELKAQNDKLQGELSKMKNSSGFEDLDAAIVEELKSQIESKETKEKELLKTLENLKMEKESLLKKIDVLNAGNEKFLEMKERQDNDIEIWQRKNNELLKEISELRQQLSNPQIPDDNVLMKENRELKNQLEALEWKNCELNELLEEKQEILEKSSSNFQPEMEKVIQEKSVLQKEIDELNNVKELLEKKLLEEEKKSVKTIEELQEQLTALGSENETLQDILGKMKESSTKKDEAGSRIFDYFKSSTDVDILPVSKSETPSETEQLKHKINELEEALKVKNEEIKKKSEEYSERIKELENLSTKEQELQKASEYLQQKLKELEGGLILRDEELHQLRNQNLEKENELANVRQNVFELESLLMLKDQESTPKRKQNVETLSQNQSFETVDLSQSTEASFPPESAESLRQRIFELENLLGFKEEELQQILQVKENEVDNLQQKINQMEEILKIKENELNNFVTLNWNQTTGNTIAEFKAQENENESLRQKICELEDLLRGKHEELMQFQNTNQSQVFEKEVDFLRERIFQLEEMVRIKDEELMRIQTINWEQGTQQNLKSAGSEIEDLRHKIYNLEEQLRLKEEELNQLQLANWNQSSELRPNGYQTEKHVNENLRQKIFQLEDVLRLREKELSSLQAANWNQSSAKEFDILQTDENEIKNLRQKILDLEELLRLKDEELNRSESSTLNQSVGPVDESVKLMDDEKEILRQKVLQLEDVIRGKDEELNRFQAINWNQNTGKEGDEFQNMNNPEILQQRVFQLEELLRLRENELGQLQGSNWSQDGRKEIEILRQKVRELEEFIKYNENELYEMQNLKDNEIQNLEQKIYQLENMNTQDQGLQQKILELENMLQFKERECETIVTEKGAEIDFMRQRIMELENLLCSRDEELSQLSVRLSELEKSYNDSKLEIERLLNEEKLNSEEKFVEPFQKNIQIPVAFELEALSRTLNEEKQKIENLKYELVEKDNLLKGKNEEIQILNAKLQFMDVKGKQNEDSKQVTIQLEKIISDLQQELENSNLQLSVTKTELEEFQNMKDEVMSNLKSQLHEMERQFLETKEKSESEIAELRAELSEKTKLYNMELEAKKNEDEKTNERIKQLEMSKSELEHAKEKLEKEMEMLKSELESKENDIESLAQMLEEERNQVAQITEILESKENEVADLRQTLTHLQGEITQFRNFEKQIKELRVAQIKEGGAELPVTSQGHPDLSDWSEHELAELSSRLQSDLDTALYMLHQRDVRCDELTFELMQLLEERDTLQLRLSTALRINEELRALNKLEKTGSTDNLQESKDLLDQSNDRQSESGPEPSEDLRLLANKISELHSVSYLRDKTVKDDSVQRHKEQMNLLSRISDSDMSLTRDVQSSPTVLLNWVRGKTTPKVMHL